MVYSKSYINKVILNLLGKPSSRRKEQVARVMAHVLSPKERRARNRAEMIAAILDTSRAIMREQGVGGLTLQEVARRVNLRTPSLYEYFPSKAVLYDALFCLGIHLFEEHRKKADQIQGTVWDRLQAWMESYMSFAQLYPELYGLLFERPVPGFIPSEESMAESRRMLGRRSAVLAADLEAAHLTVDLPIAQLIDLLIAMMHGLTSQHMANEPELPAGVGRYGSLIPVAIAWFRAGWEGAPVRIEPMHTSSDVRD